MNSIVYKNLDTVIKNLDIFKNKYSIIKPLKINTNRATYIAYDIINNKQKVLKFIVKNYVSDTLLSIYQFFMNNTHKNFIKINSINDYNIVIMLDMDYIKGYNMFDCFMNASKRVNYYNILFDMVFALDYIHKNNIIHGDIKPNNIIVNSLGTPVLIDYDLCRYINNSIKSKPFGTKIFMPPELINDNIYFKNSDIWCLGLSFVISMLYKYNSPITFGNIYSTYIYKSILYNFNDNKKNLMHIYGKLFINSISIMLVENYKSRVSSNELSEILKQSNYYIYKQNIKMKNENCNINKIKMT